MIPKAFSKFGEAHLSIQAHRYGLISRSNVKKLRLYHSSQKPPMTLEDMHHPRIFECRSLSKLLFGYIILRTASWPITFKYAERALDLCKKLRITVPAYWLVKKTYYKYFTAGETLEDIKRVVEELSQDNIKIIVDYSVEQCDWENDGVIDVLVESIKLAQNNPNIPFVCFKFSAIVPSELLSRLDHMISSCVEVESDQTSFWLDLINQEDYDQCLQKLSQTLTTKVKGAAPPPLSAEEIKSFTQLKSKLEKLINASIEYDVPLLVDAEQSYYQKTIHFLTLHLMKRYNKKKPMIYNTYQMYLKKGLSTLESHLQIAERADFQFGAKVVRGGYIESETAYAKENNTEYPVFTNIQETADSYIAGVDTILRHMKDSRKHYGIVIATHNEQSVTEILNWINEHQIELDSKPIYFSQLHGMSDYISLALAQANYNVCKYVPFGPISEVLPYMLRRIQENQKVLGSTRPEQRLIMDAIKSRLHLSLSPLSKQ